MTDDCFPHVSRARTDHIILDFIRVRPVNGRSQHHCCPLALPHTVVNGPGSATRSQHAMAAMTTPSKEPTTSTSSRADPLSIRSPLPLSASQEGQVRELYYKRVRQKCADEVRGLCSSHRDCSILTTCAEFATCAHNRTFTATFMCRAEQKAMNECMVNHATQEEQDAARTEWFASIEARHQARVKKEEKRVKDEKFWLDWWNRDLSKKPGHSEDGTGTT